MAAESGPIDVASAPADTPPSPPSSPPSPPSSPSSPSSPAQRARQRLLLADRVKTEANSFLAPLLPALRRHYDVRFVAEPPNETLAAAVRWADIVWLEWCWDHAVWVTRSGLLQGKPCIVRLHSIEALQTPYPSQVAWNHVGRLLTVGGDIADVVAKLVPGIVPRLSIVPNGIDLQRFAPGDPDRFQIAWVGHLEPKKNPMLLLQVAQRLLACDPRYAIHVAGAFTDLRTTRYLEQMVPSLGLGGAIRFHGQVADMPAWYADKGVLLSTSMYESFGLNIGEAMAVGAFPVVHAFPGAEGLWPRECLFASVEEAVALIRTARPGLYREWVAERYGLDRQVDAVLGILREVAGIPVAA